ncbi:uncharacterized protein DS421_7g203010 [Arachis hypogaea]|nr:uncharacterized protein DS421_7g203010 [Arachis hypogaea]
MSEEKKTIVRDLEFSGLMHIPPLRVHHQVLRELANNFKLGENRLETGYGSFKISPKTIGDALGINASGDLFPQKVNYKKLSEDDKEIFRRFQGKTLKNLTDEMMDIGVGNEQDRLMFKRIFILYIQMAFLLPMTINKISHVHLASIFEMDTITERNWGGHVLSFIIKGITDYKEKKKKAIDGCLFALMIIYFHLSKNKDKKRAERPPKSWIANWSKEQLVKGMRAEIKENMYVLNNDCLPFRMDSKKRKKSQEDSDSESESTDESEIGSEDLDELLRENNENSAAQGEKEADLRSTEGHYVSSETIPDVNLGSDDPSSQGHTEQSSVNRPAESMLSLVEESASEPADLNMMVVRKETPSEGLVIVSIQVCLPVFQTTTGPEFEETPETEYESTPLLQIEGTTKTTPEPPKNLKKAHPHFPQLHLKYNNPAPEDAAALMMMARTASYIPKKDLLPSFSLGFTDSSQKETTTQEGASTQDVYVEKTPETPKLLEQLEDLNMALANHPEGVFLQPKNNKPFRVEDYPIYDCAIYVMKWLEIFEPANIKRRKYEWDNWTQDEVDHFRVEYASRILFHDMNLDKHEAIRRSNTIRLLKPSSLLLSPYCQIDSQNVDTA